MKKLFIVANWKSNKDSSEVNDWIQKVSGMENKEVVICPPFTLLSLLKERIRNQESGIKVGAQDVSPFEEGAYTGEVSANQIKEFADYVIIGHSERRKNFGETDEVVDQKIKMAIKYGLIPILCVSDIKQIQNSKFKIQNYNSKLIIAYEPTFAIGTGKPDTPENADSVASTIKKELGDIPVLYGGSVTSTNVNTFTKMPNIDGVLVGSASLDPLEFLEVIKNA